MRTAVDPRFAARRIAVREGWARRRLRWLVGLLAGVLLAAAGYAVLQSPWLAVRTITVEGVSNAELGAILDRYRVVPGSPTVGVRPGVLEEAIREDPWVADARVTVTWPGTIEVAVLERTPAAWLRTADGWTLVAFDGTLLAAGQPERSAPRVVSDVGKRPIGSTVHEPAILGAATMLGLLPAELSTGATAQVTPTGIEAEIAGHRVLFGNERDMADKVAAVVAIFANELTDPAATINVISPMRPGLLYPQPPVEGRPEEIPSSANSG